MLEAKLTIACPGLEMLAAAILAASKVQHPAPAAPVQAPAPTAVTPAAPFMPSAPVAPVVPVAPVAGPVPTAVTPAPTAPAPSFTQEQIAKAGADMIAADAGKMSALRALLQQFGVQAITELKPQQAGPFATALRGLGAKI